jgi:hypothetical protein
MELIEAYKNKQGEVKSCVLHGEETRKYKEQIMLMGGKYNSNLNVDGKSIKGYYFSLSKIDDVKNFLTSVENGTVEEIKLPFHKIDELPFEKHDKVMLAVPNTDGNILTDHHLLHPKGSKNNLLIKQLEEIDGTTFVYQGVSYRIARE